MVLNDKIYCIHYIHLYYCGVMWYIIYITIFIMHLYHCISLYITICYYSYVYIYIYKMKIICNRWEYTKYRQYRGVYSSVSANGSLYIRIYIYIMPLSAPDGICWLSSVRSGLGIPIKTMTAEPATGMVPEVFFLHGLEVKSKR